MAELILKHIRKTYGSGKTAVKDFSLNIADGEFVIIVGPSGCGKSTTLRMIAGLAEADGGEIFMDGQSLRGVSAQKRDMAMVFQNYALYQTMTVFDNIAFPLRMRKLSKGEIAEKVKAAAALLEIEALLDRYPGQLSGGERQRVAMGRAMVRQPKVFLMDEPLSNLDAKLRIGLRSKIAELHRTLKVTTVYVTHDQVEAMTLADRIVVMKDGEIAQVGTPQEIYQNPASAFVGSFFGNPPMNLYERDGKQYGIRPEHVRILDRSEAAALGDGQKTLRYPAKVLRRELVGAEVIYYLQVGEALMIATASAEQSVAADTVSVRIDRDKVCRFEAG